MMMVNNKLKTVFENEMIQRFKTEDEGQETRNRNYKDKNKSIY
jgi:hypothetical protein